jgi:hypothetical protein
MALRGRLGGLVRSATHDGATVTKAARSTFTDSFRVGHGCSVCPPIEIPIDLPANERARRAAVLRKLHYTRVASLPRRGRRAAA